MGKNRFWRSEGKIRAFGSPKQFNHTLFGGIPMPLKNHESQLGLLFPNIGEILFQSKPNQIIPYCHSFRPCCRGSDPFFLSFFSLTVAQAFLHAFLVFITWNGGHLTWTLASNHHGMMAFAIGDRHSQMNNLTASSLE